MAYVPFVVPAVGSRFAIDMMVLTETDNNKRMAFDVLGTVWSCTMGDEQDAIWDNIVALNEVAALTDEGLARLLTLSAMSLLAQAKGAMARHQEFSLV